MLRVVRQLSNKSSVIHRGFGATAAIESSSGGVPAYATHAPPVEVSTAGNGVKVVTESTFSGEGAVTVSVKVGAGSRFETANVNGLAAFAASASLDTVAADAAKIGAFGVCTDRELSTFTATVMTKDVPKAMELLGKALTEDVKDCDRDARAGIVDCHAMDFRTGIMDQLHEAAFLSTPLGMAPMGTGATVAGISAPDLNAFKKAHFTSDSISVSVAGAGVDHATVSGLVEKSMSAGAPSSSLAKPAAAAVFTGSDKRIRFDSHPDALVSVAFQGASNASADWFPMKVMKHILGDWSESSPIGANSSTKLGRELAEHGFVKSYGAFHVSYADAGLFGVTFQATDNNLEDSIWYVMDNFVRLCHDVTDEEVERAKSSMKTTLLTMKGGANTLAETNGSQLSSTGRVMSTAELLTRIDAVTTADVKAAANTYINDEDHALAAVGPIFELPDYNWIRRRSYWHRF